MKSNLNTLSLVLVSALGLASGAVLADSHGGDHADDTMKKMDDDGMKKMDDGMKKTPDMKKAMDN